MAKILLLGDTHGEFEWMNFVYDIANKFHGPFDRVIQLGDYGFGPSGRSKIRTGTHPWTVTTPLLVIPGNHENWDTVTSYVQGENTPEFYVADRPEIIDRDGIRILAIPGADSIDADARERAGMFKSWWWQERISDKDVEVAIALLRANNPVDIIATHAAPAALESQVTRGFTLHPDEVPSSRALNLLLHELQYRTDITPPWLWVCGHYHVPRFVPRPYPGGDLAVLPIASRNHFMDVSGYGVLDTDARVLTVYMRNNAVGHQLQDPSAWRSTEYALRKD